MKRCFLIPVMTCMAIAAEASDYSHLVFRHKDGSEYSVKSEGLHITVSGDNLMVSHSDGNSTFSLPELSSMAFSSAPSGLDDISAQDNSGVDVYTTTGIYVGHFESAEAALERIATSGLYVFSNKHENSKILIKK